MVKKKKKIDSSYVKYLAWLLHDEKRKRVGKLKDIDKDTDGDDDILKKHYKLRSSRKRYKRLKVQSVADGFG